MAGKPLQLLVVVIDLAGGTGAFCRTLATGLRRYHREDFSVSLLLLRDRGLLPGDSELFDRIHVLRSDVHKDWRRVIETPLHAWRLRQTIRKLPSDLIFTISTYSNLLVPLVARRRRIVLSVHSNSTRQLGESPFGRPIGWLMRWIYPRHPLIAPSQGIVDDLVRRYGVKHATMIPHAVDADHIEALSAERPPDLPPQASYLLACGRLTSAKDYPTLLHAYAQARGNGVSQPLLIIGEGEQRQALAGLVDELRLAGHVQFLGHRDNPFPYMRQARFFVLSSAWEGFGLVLLEAMTLGVPCIATDCPSGPGEILAGGKYGLLVPPGNVAALSDAIVALNSSHHLRQELAGKSRLRARQLGLEQMAQQYSNLFAQCVNVEVRDSVSAGPGPTPDHGSCG